MNDNKKPPRGSGGAKKTNPRYSNGALRRKYRERFKAMQLPCAICNGRLGPIRYDQPSDGAHPLSFVIDEIRPVSKWKVFGYESPEAAAQDWNNLQPAHRCCNSLKSNKTDFKFGEAGKDQKATRQIPNIRGSEW